jgi:hypothetical protein
MQNGIDAETKRYLFCYACIMYTCIHAYIGMCAKNTHTIYLYTHRKRVNACRRAGTSAKSLTQHMHRYIQTYIHTKTNEEHARTQFEVWKRKYGWIHTYIHKYIHTCYVSNVKFWVICLNNNIYMYVVQPFP